MFYSIFLGLFYLLTLFFFNFFALTHTLSLLPFYPQSRIGSMFRVWSTNCTLVGAAQQFRSTVLYYTYTPTTTLSELYMKWYAYLNTWYAFNSFTDKKNIDLLCIIYPLVYADNLNDFWFFSGERTRANDPSGCQARKRTPRYSNASRTWGKN